MLSDDRKTSDNDIKSGLMPLENSATRRLVFFLQIKLRGHGVVGGVAVRSLSSLANDIVAAEFLDEVLFS